MPNNFIEDKYQIYQKIFKYLLLFGIISSFYNLAFNRSLWIDESMLALNIVNLSFIELFSPLKYYNQVAPIGFLLVEKIIAKIFSYSEWSLRAFPFLCFLTSIYYLFNVIITITKNQILALYGSAFFSQCYYLLYYSSEVKQYSTEVLSTTVLLYYYLLVRKHPSTANFNIFAALGLISIFLTNTSIIILTTLGSALLYPLIKDGVRKHKKRLWLVLIWSIFYAGYYNVFLLEHPSQDFMLTYWNENNGFIKTNVLSFDFIISLKEKLEILVSLTGQGYKLLPMIFLGVYSIYKKDKTLTYILIFPIILHFILSYFKLYPTQTRLLLYLTPILIVLMVMGFESLLTTFSKYSPIILFMMAFTLLFNLYSYKQWGFPIKHQEVKQLLNRLNTEVVENDELLIYYSAWPTYLFYKRKFEKIQQNISKEKNMINYVSCKEKYSDFVCSSGKNVWLIFADAYTKSQITSEADTKYILNLFFIEGFAVIHEFHSDGAKLYKLNIK